MNSIDYADKAFENYIKALRKFERLGILTEEVLNDIQETLHIGTMTEDELIDSYPLPLYKE